MEYQVQIIESLQRTATVSATSENEAVRLARKLYEKEEIVLDSNDFVGVDFALSESRMREKYRKFLGAFRIKA